MKILFCEIKNKCDQLDWEGLYLRDKLAKSHEVEFFAQPVQYYKGDLSLFDCLSTFIHSQVDKTVFEKMTNLKLVATRSTGFDHIDLVECKSRNAQALNVPFYGENTVAEYAFALLSMLSRKMYEARDRVIRSNYEADDLMGFDLQGKTFGIVGGGHIGMYAAKIAKGYGMKVIVFDVKPMESLAKEIGFEYVDLDSLYQKADIISLHVPLIPPTKHMINKAAFAKMKDGVVLINTARGGIVDTTDLVEALNSGKLGGVCLDVLEEEEFLAAENSESETTLEIEKLRLALEDHILMDHPKVVMTFHNAFNTIEGRSRILDTTVENIEKFAKGEVVNSVIK